MLENIERDIKECLVKTRILKLFSDVHDLDFLERIAESLERQKSIDKNEHTFYSIDTVCGN